MQDFEPIAERELIGKRRDGTRFRVLVRIGRPHSADGFEWKCSLQMDEFLPKQMDISGVDSLQALSLAIRLVRHRLVDFVEDGGQLFWPDQPDEPTSVESIL